MVGILSGIAQGQKRITNAHICYMYLETYGLFFSYFYEIQVIGSLRRVEKP